VVSLDLPTSWTMAGKAGDEFTSRMFEAINGMLLDMLAAVARKDYDDRRRRQAQGIVKAKAEGAFKGRPEDVQRNVGIAAGTHVMSADALQRCVRPGGLRCGRRKHRLFGGED
jgi:DNA invertase Pin-like site-specific DNA recombinase